MALILKMDRPEICSRKAPVLQLARNHRIETALGIAVFILPVTHCIGGGMLVLKR